MALHEDFVHNVLTFLNIHVLGLVAGRKGLFTTPSAHVPWIQVWHFKGAWPTKCKM